MISPLGRGWGEKNHGRKEGKGCLATPSGPSSSIRVSRQVKEGGGKCKPDFRRRGISAQKNIRGEQAPCGNRTDQLPPIGAQMPSRDDCKGGLIWRNEAGMKACLGETEGPFGRKRNNCANSRPRFQCRENVFLTEGNHPVLHSECSKRALTLGIFDSPH